MIARHQFRLSDSELNEELSQYLKRREMEQKFLYLGDGAHKYYKAVHNTDNVDRDEEKYAQSLDFFCKNIDFDLNTQHFSFVSLGCGNAIKEKYFLQEFINRGYKFSYIGVDASSTMLLYAEETLKDITGLKKEFICADFTSNRFLNDIRICTKDYDYNVFAFLGWTFGNPNQTSITDSLYNMLGVNDRLWLDVLSRKANDSNIKMKLFDRYTEYLNNEKLNLFQFTPLEKIGVPFENGKLTLETYNEKAVGTMVFTFSFLFTKKTVISFRNETIHFLPGEKINLLTARNYDPDILTMFFMEHNFSLVARANQMINEWLQESQFLFKKLS